MARNGNLAVTDRILAIRERWHTKRHPFFLAFGEGKLPLRALGRYQALHYHFVSRALASFGMLYARGYHFEDVRKMIAENIAEEEGLKAIPEPGHEPHDHNELILRFCRAAGLTDDEVRITKMPPAWWARAAPLSLAAHRATRATTELTVVGGPRVRILGPSRRESIANLTPADAERPCRCRIGNRWGPGKMGSAAAWSWRRY